MAMTWAPAPAGYDGETGSHIATQAASRYFTEYRTPDGYRWSPLVDNGGTVYLPDGSSCYVQYDADRLPADVAARVRAVLRIGHDLKSNYPTPAAIGPDADELMADHDALMTAMDDPNSDL